MAGLHTVGSATFYTGSSVFWSLLGAVRRWEHVLNGNTLLQCFSHYVTLAIYFNHSVAHNQTLICWCVKGGVKRGRVTPQIFAQPADLEVSALILTRVLCWALSLSLCAAARPTGSDPALCAPVVSEPGDGIAMYNSAGAGGSDVTVGARLSVHIRADTRYRHVHTTDAMERKCDSLSGVTVRGKTQLQFLRSICNPQSSSV